MLPVSQSIVQKKKRGEKDLIVSLFVKKKSLSSPFNWTPWFNKILKKDDNDKKQERKNKGKSKKTNKQTLCFTCFLKGLRGGYSFSEVEKGTSQWNDRNRKGKKKKKHSISWIEIYLSPEANLLLAGYIWTGFSYLPFDSAQCRCCL